MKHTAKTLDDLPVYEDEVISEQELYYLDIVEEIENQLANEWLIDGQ